MSSLYLSESARLIPRPFAFGVGAAAAGGADSPASPDASEAPASALSGALAGPPPGDDSGDGFSTLSDGVSAGISAGGASSLTIPASGNIPVSGGKSGGDS